MMKRHVGVSGWYFTDDAAAPTKYRIPTNSILAPGGYLSFDETQFNAGGGNVPFLLSSTGEEVYLFSAANGQLTGYSHGVVFGASFNGVSFGRYVNSAGEELFPQQTYVTLNSADAGPRIGPIVINEIHYHPAISNEEFIELLNITDNPMPLFHPAYPTNAWKLGGVGYTFPTNIMLGAEELLLLVMIDPTDFRTKYDVPAGGANFRPGFRRAAR
jgi:hypothetical protein